MAQNITPSRFLANETRKYQNRYRRLFGLKHWEDDPEHRIPGSDHAFTLGPWLVSRPYPISTEGLRDLVSWAEKYGFEVLISGQSSWHPWTVVVEVWLQKWWVEFATKTEGYGDAFATTVWEKVWRRKHAVMMRVNEPSPRWSSGVDTGICVLVTETNDKGLDIKTALAPIKPFFFSGQTE